MTRVYVVRHAEAEGNLFRRIHGHYNGSLTLLGLRQLDALEARFAGIHIDKVYSSDLARAVMTSTAVTRSRGIKPVPVPSLREIYMGDWEDLEWGGAEARSKEQFDFFHADPARWRVPGAETFLAAQDRMLNSLLDLAHNNDGRVIALFSHAAAIRALASKLLGVSGEHIGQVDFCGNTGITELEVSGDNVDVICYGDAAHITPELKRRRSRTRRLTGKISSINLSFEPADGWPRLEGLSHPIRSDRIYNALLEGRIIVGCVAVNAPPAGAPDTAELSAYYLVPEYRDFGFLCQLVGRAVSDARSMGAKYLTVEDSEHRDKFTHYGFEKRLIAGGREVLAMDISVKYPAL